MGIDVTNPGAKGVPFYTPAQEPAPGSALDPSTAPTLFQPLKIRGTTMHNRFGVSPMCTYSANDGHLTDWHLVHLGQYALHGAGLVMVEATSTEPRGRISPQDSGLWSDTHIEPLKKVADFIRSQGSVSAVQIGHAGRKASSLAPWIGGSVKKIVADEEAGGWPSDVVGPSAIRYNDKWPETKALTNEEVKGLVRQFAESAERAVKAGIEVIEIHGAHGYLISQFLSPISNQRTDEYGGSFENRTRFLFEIIAAIRAVIPSEMPLWLRISATEYMEWAGSESWDLESSIRLAKLLPAAGIDVLDVSSGGNNPNQKISPHRHIQTDFAGQIREAVKAEGLDLLIAAVGWITEAEMAKSVVEDGTKKTVNGDAHGQGTIDTIEVEGESGQKTQADIVLAGRQFLREPEWPLKVAGQLGVDVQWAHQYGRAPDAALQQKQISSGSKL